MATVGPACDQAQTLGALIRAGVDVFRLNAAHGTRDDHQRRLDIIRASSREVNIPVGVLLDLAGPKIRLGALPGGVLECVAGAVVRFVRGPAATVDSNLHAEVYTGKDAPAAEAGGPPRILTTTYPTLVDELDPGHRVMLADGTVSLVVESKEADAVNCRVVQGGTIRSRQGVNLPRVRLQVPPLNEEDRANAVWAARAGVDFVGLSFVRAAGDVHELKRVLAAENATAQVVAKIEKPEALDDLEAIVAATDAVMVARGDLGVEIDIAQVPAAQKRIISACTRAGKPVIVATQMLESMHASRMPTRAEAADVANAILDGADACMLSGETAIGQYPVEAVETMHRIALATEPLLRERARTAGPPPDTEGLDPITRAIACHAGRLAETLEARLILVATASGTTARALSRGRWFVPTLGISANEATLRRMCLYWGVIPLANVRADSPDALLQEVVTRGQSRGWLGAGDRIVLLAGTGLTTTAHNSIVVHEV
ncbi:MAG: pyruvate kinase [Phycisphaerae bacterium]